MRREYSAVKDFGIIRIKGLKDSRIKGVKG
jgi:hypothetical protein